jgi:hypothetical protein
MYAWLKENYRDEWHEEQTEEQFMYKTRKKALGPFKKNIMKFEPGIRDAIAAEVETKLDFLFKELRVVNTLPVVNRYINDV